MKQKLDKKFIAAIVLFLFNLYDGGNKKNMCVAVFSDFTHQNIQSNGNLVCITVHYSSPEGVALFT